jgi:hypothetical protein
VSACRPERLVAECSHVRDFAGGAAGDAGPSTPAATRPAAADPRQPALHAPAARSDTTPNTAAENLSAKGRICRGPAGASGRMRPQSPRQTPHPSARRPCGATVTGHPSAGARNWHTPSTLGDQLGQPRSTRKRRTVNPLMISARYNFLYSSFKTGPRAGSDTTATGEPASPSSHRKGAIPAESSTSSCGL